MDCQALFQEDFALTGIAPHPERSQVHSQVVLLHLEGKILNKAEDNMAEQVPDPGSSLAPGRGSLVSVQKLRLAHPPPGRPSIRQG